VCERIGDVHVECWPGATADACTLRMITINNSYDTTAATAATPTTASAVDHLVTRSVASPPATADQRELGHEHALVLLVQSVLGHKCMPLTCGYSSPRSDGRANPQVTGVRVQVPLGHEPFGQSAMLPVLRLTGSGRAERLTHG
jgi:hypothetical protein